MDRKDFSDPNSEDTLDNVFGPPATSHVPDAAPLAQIHRPDQKNGPAKGSRRRVKKSKVPAAAGAATLAVAFVAAIVALTTMSSSLPWLADDAAAPVVDPVVPDVPAITPGGPSPAEQVLSDVVTIDLPGLSKWQPSDVSTTVAATSFGFGCDSKAGLAPTVSRSRSYTTGSSTVALSLDAFPAGGGAVAVEAMREAASACDEASLGSVPMSVSDLGVENERVSAKRVSALVWRRGDVVVTASVTTNGQAGDPSMHADDFARLDEALNDRLEPVCVNQVATVKDAARSPYLDRGSYKGLFDTEKVELPPIEEPSAEDRTKFPVVAIPPETLPVPDLGDVPVAPIPAPTQGPTRLPAEVGAPTVPAAPEEPTWERTSRFRVADIDGPGCGWAFTAQSPPEFDEAGAEMARTVNYEEAMLELTAQWRKWQKAKMRFYREFDSYTKSVKTYRAYVKKVAAAREAWAVIEAARDAYYAALTDYQAAVEARDTFLADRDAAKVAYEEARTACANRPTAAPSPTGRPKPNPAPEMVCPPVRPEILDETAPAKPVSPTPEPEAQLPAGR